MHWTHRTCKKYGYDTNISNGEYHGWKVLFLFPPVWYNSKLEKPLNASYSKLTFTALEFLAHAHSLSVTQSLLFIIIYYYYAWLSDIFPTGRAPFGRIADTQVLLEENDFQDTAKAQERVQGSLIIRDIASTKPRPPPTGVCSEKFQLCKW